MSVTPEDVKKYAKLSALACTDERAAQLAPEMSKIVEMVSQLQAVDTEGVAPMASTVSGHGTPEREDEITAENRREDYQTVAPSTEFGFYKVPRVVE